ncbi:MAG: GatB/YqeY domain-containing protein, partial [Micrococcaceae bacterium]|nr:GatB/YqeY domain-containing protein [Micrococcaceae bacterium]
QDRAAAENAEAEIIEAYLPAPLDEAAVSGIIDGAIATLREGGTELSMRSMGQVMKLVSAEVAGRFDGKKVSEMVRSSLG